MWNASGWKHECVLCLVIFAASCGKTDASAAPVAAAKDVREIAVTPAVPTHPSVCTLIPKADMESLTHVVFATMEDETPRGQMNSTCRYFMAKDHPGQLVEVTVEWTPDLAFARQRMSMAKCSPRPDGVAHCNPDDFENISGLGDDASWYQAGTLTVQKGTILITVGSTLLERAPKPGKAARVNPHLEPDKLIARAVLEKI